MPSSQSLDDAYTDAHCSSSLQELGVVTVYLACVMTHYHLATKVSSVPSSLFTWM